MPNSEVKLSSADDSVGFPHVKVGHRQLFIFKANQVFAFFLPKIIYCIFHAELRSETI